MTGSLKRKRRFWLKVLSATILPILFSSLIVSCGSASIPRESENESENVPENTPEGETHPATIKIGYSKFAYPPLHYFDKAGKLVGFDIDLACNALALMSMEPEFVPIDWTNRAELLETGEVDMLWGGLERASLDESIVKFTKSYLRSNIVFLMNEEDDYAKFEDLQGLEVCALNFTPAFYYLQVYNQDVIKSRRAFTPPEYHELFGALSSGDFDCMITDTSFASFLIKSTGLPYKMSDTILGSNYAVAVRIADTELFSSLQEALDKLEANGTVAHLQEEWIK